MGYPVIEIEAFFLETKFTPASGDMAAMIQADFVVSQFIPEVDQVFGWQQLIKKSRKPNLSLYIMADDVSQAEHISKLQKDTPCRLVCAQVLKPGYQGKPAKVRNLVLKAESLKAAQAAA